MKTEKSSPATEKEIIAAFARGDVLSNNKRRRLMTKHFKGSVDMSATRACLVAIKYGLGLIEESGIALVKLTKAWLRIGEKVWQRIVAVARDLDWVSISYSKLCRALKLLARQYPIAGTW